MAEDTTTEAPVETGATIQGVQVDDQGMAVAEPEQTEQVTAVETTEEEEKPEEPATAEPETEADSEQEQLAKFAKAKGLELDSENATKAAKMAMNAEKQMHAKSVRASELEKSMGTISDEYAEETAQQTGQDPEIVKRLQRMEVKDAVRDFWSQDGVDRKFEPKMIELLAEKPHLAGDLESLYAVAVNKSLKSEGKREALTNLAHKQQASVPTGNAVNGSPTTSTTQITPQNVDQLVGQNDLKWFETHKKEINAALAQ